MGELLRNAENAYIDPRKLRDYALSLSHDSGRYKAAFFAQMGYNAEKWWQLENDIREQHLTQRAEEGSASPFGIKYTITAQIQGPVRRKSLGNDSLDIPPRRRSSASRDYRGGEGAFRMNSQQLELLDTVIVTVDLPSEEVLAGDLGTIVEIYNAPSPAYEVEFVNPDGTTRALLTLLPEEIRPLSAMDVLTTRQVMLAG